MSSSHVEFSIPGAPPARDPFRDRRPPYSEDAEQAVLGAMLMDADAIMRAAEYVDDTMFYREGHRRIFRAMITLTERGEVVDPLTLADELGRRGELESSGGKEYVGFLVDAVPTAANVEYHARIVREKALLRRLIEVSTSIVSEAFEGKLMAAELLDEAESKIFQVSQAQGTGGFTRIKELMWPTMERIEALHKHGSSVTGVPSGFRDLDEMTSGFQPSDLVIVAARPSMGKCLSHDQEVLLADGSVATIEEVYRRGEARLLTLDGHLTFSITSPSAFVDDGIKPVFRVTTRLGRQVETTITHPFLTVDGWRPLAELAVGSHVAVPRVLGVFGDRAMRECEVKLLAYLLGDGDLTSSCPRFTNGDERVLADFESAVAEFGGFAATCVSPSAVSTWVAGASVPGAGVFAQVCATLELDPAERAPEGRTVVDTHRPNGLAAWLDGLGVWGRDSHDKFVPEAVFTLPRAQLARFLNRLFATDGWATVLATGQAQLGYCSASERLARQVQHLLLRFGIVASLRRRSAAYRGARCRAWQLDITDGRAIQEFAQAIGMFGKEAALERAAAVAAGRQYRTNRDLIPKAVWARIARAKGSESWASLGRRAGLAGWTNVHAGRRAVPRDRLAAFAEALDDHQLRLLASSEVYWDEIVSIEHIGEKQVYDLTIPETHNFVANDVCVHNTAFTLNLAQHAAIESGISVAVFSLEMSKESLVQRMLTAEARVDAQAVRRGRLRDDDFPRLARAAGILSQAPIYIDDTPGIGILEMRSKARRLKAESGLGMVIVDYLQLMQGPASAENRQQEVSQISRSLKALAKELNVPVVALSQLSRAPEQRAGEDKGRPQLSDLRESGAIEQDADLILFLYRPEVYFGPVDKDGNSLEGRAEVIVGKQRNGPIGSVNLFFHKQFTLFDNFSNREPGK